MSRVFVLGLILTVLGSLSGSKTMEGMGITILGLIVLWLLFGDDDRAVLFRMFVLPIVVVIGAVYLGGLFIGKFL